MFESNLLQIVLFYFVKLRTLLHLTKFLAPLNMFPEILIRNKGGWGIKIWYPDLCYERCNIYFRIKKILNTIHECLSKIFSKLARCIPES